MYLIYILGIAVLLYLIGAIRVLKQYERGVVFLLGKFEGVWQQFTIEVTQCQPDSICAKVVAGPKNVGMELFASKLTSKDGMLFGQIVHPDTKDIYNTRFQQTGHDTWRLDGCTLVRVCLNGEFVRVK
jgi:hypothetical protein